MKWTDTRIFRDQVVKEFGAHLQALGYRPDSNYDTFYPYRALKGNVIHLVEIQFDQYGRPKFVLNCGVTSLRGIVDPYGRFLDATEVKISHLARVSRLYRLPYSIAWFKPGSLFGLRSIEHACLTTTHQLIKLFRQVEGWFEGGKAGPNLKIYNYPHNEPYSRKKWMQQQGTWPPLDWNEVDEKKSEMARLFEDQRHR